MIRLALVAVVLLGLGFAQTGAHHRPRHHPTPVPPPAVRVSVHLYDYTTPEWGVHVRQEADYYTSILAAEGYTFVYHPMGYLADPAACRATVPPGPGVRFCLDPRDSPAASSTARIYGDNGDGTWGITANIYFHVGGLVPGPDSKAGQVLPCHELGHVTGSLAHTIGESQDCMNTSRWNWPVLRPEQVAQIISKRPLEPPPSALGTTTTVREARDADRPGRQGKRR